MLEFQASSPIECKKKENTDNYCHKFIWFFAHVFLMKNKTKIFKKKILMRMIEYEDLYIVF